MNEKGWQSRLRVPAGREARCEGSSAGCWGADGVTGPFVADCCIREL